MARPSGAAGLAVAAVFLLIAGRAGGDDSGDERLIGWQGEKARDQASVTEENQQAATPSRPRPWVETISWTPRAFIHHGFLTEEECDHLTGIGNKRVQRSTVIDSKSGGSKVDSIRTSFGAAFQRGEDPVIAEIEQRIAEWTRLPPEHGEPMQILRYTNGQKYDAHWDWFHKPKGRQATATEQARFRNGQRVATVLLYLAEVEAGGETILPLAEAIDEGAQELARPSPCADRMGLAVKPRKGDALLFWDMDVAGEVEDRRALHASCPTLKGTKWTATKWIHNVPYEAARPLDLLGTAGRCTDDHPDCDAWEREGRCKSDPATMVGPEGKCRKACGDCQPCAKGDAACLRRNMEGLRSASALAA